MRAAPATLRLLPSPGGPRSAAPSRSLCSRDRRCMRRATPQGTQAAISSNQVLRQSRADPGGNRIELGAVRRMVDAHRKAAALLEPRARGTAELEAQEMHRGSLFLVLALEILVGDREDPRAALDLHPHTALDSLQLAQHLAPLLDFRIFDQQGRLPVAAVRNQRVVRIELLLDAVLLEDALDPQHFLHLVAKRELVLEQKRHVLPKAHRAVLLVLDDPGAKSVALARIRFEREEVFSFNHSIRQTVQRFLEAVGMAALGPG